MEPIKPLRTNVMTTNARSWALFKCAFCLILLVLPNAKSGASPKGVETNERIFAAEGIVRGLDQAAQTVTISHGTISNFMDAMTMPFKVKQRADMTGLHSGDKITFRLHVTQTNSWVDDLRRIGAVPGNASDLPQTGTSPAKPPSLHRRNSLWYCKFTNELGQAVSLSDFQGQALAITFIYTRCPLPDYCPRLSRNFQEASQKLEALPSAPTNWHFLSFSFNPQFDTPAVLKAYAEGYQYDPRHWSFLTGSPDKIAELARESGVNYVSDHGLIRHNFRTLIVNRNGHLQTVFPTSGDFSDSIVAEILKAATVTNQTIVSR